MLLFPFLAFNLLPVSLLSNTNQNTWKTQCLAVLFGKAEVRLNCLHSVETSRCPSLVQDERGGRTYPMDLYERNRLVCQLRPVLFPFLFSFSGCTDHINSGWSSTFFLVLISSGNLQEQLIVASRCKTDKSNTGCKEDLGTTGFKQKHKEKWSPEKNMCRLFSLASYFLILKQHGCICYTVLTCPKLLSEPRQEFYPIKARIYVLITPKYRN